MCKKKTLLQSDINKLLDWAAHNKMSFHPGKSKVLPISNSNNPNSSFVYSIGPSPIPPIEYCDKEKDLGLNVNSKLNWNDHCNIIYSKANQKLGLLKRSCSFITNKSKRRALYLSQVRSQFEHCPIVWRPSSKTSIERLESIQKKAFKWILNDMGVSFSVLGNYYRTCKQLNILPIGTRFDLKDLTFFHSIFYEISVVSFPTYLYRFTGSRLRSCHLDTLSMCSTVHPRIPQNLISENSCLGISKSYFYRAHLAWNRLPIIIREIESPVNFRRALEKHLWKELFFSDTIPDD